VVGLLVIKVLGSGVMVGASLLAVAVGLAVLTNRKGLADRVQRHEERDVVDWNASIASRHEYFKGVVRLYSLGLIAWGAFFPGLVIAIWLGPRPAGVAAVVAAVGGIVAIISLFSIFGIAFAMGWQSRRAMTALGFPLLAIGLAPLRSAPWQVNAEFWGAVSVGVLVDVLVALALKSG
jgi:hypothetical protein